MFRVTIEDRFSAAHALLIRGTREPVHGHDWHVTATIAGRDLDEDGLLVDFHALEEDLKAILGPFRNQDLHTRSPFDRVNPSAEAVARHIALELSRRLETRLAREPKYSPRGVRVESVRVTEAPGCAATYCVEG